MSLAAATAKLWYLAAHVQIPENYVRENIKTSRQQLGITIAQFDVGNSAPQQVDLACPLAENRAQLAKLTSSYLQLDELPIPVFAPLGGWRQVVAVCAPYAEPSTRKQLEA